ncbi:DUF3344 domain-containing protein, partial [Methanobrevibacter sp.]
MSSAFAYDSDSSADDLAVYNNDEFISIDNQDDGYPESVSVDEDEKLDYASNTNNGYIKFDQENITVTEGEGLTVTGNLVDSRGRNPAGGDFALDVYFDGDRKGIIDLYSHKLSYNVPSSWLTVSDSPHILKFVAAEEGEYEMFLEETGGLFVADSWVEITVEGQSTDTPEYPVGQILPSMSQVDSGVVSGAADFVAVNPVSSPGSLVYTVPENVTDLKSAIAIVNIYSGSGAPSYGLYSNITLNTNNGLEVLGYEALWFDKNTANDVNVYGINDHTTKQYSDYQMIYDITDKVNNLNSGDTITINVANSRYENLQYDGRIKLIGLLFAYDDGDDDEVAYWLNAGQLWTTDTANFDFSTQDYAGETNNMTIRTIALSSTLASSFKINNVVTPYTSVKGGPFTYQDIFWNNIGTNFNQGAKTNFWYQNGGASYKTNVALLVASDIKKQEPLTEVYVDYENGLDTNLGVSEDTAFKTIAHALDAVADNGVINVKGVNYLDDVSANGLTIDKNITIIGLGSDATIDGRDAGRIFNIGAHTVNLFNLAFINADASTASDKRGGALYVNGATLTVDNCKFINNSGGASSSYGGAINLKSSTTTIRNSEFDGNDAW